MYKFSLKQIREARQRLDRSRHGSDEEYYAHLINEFASMAAYNYASLREKGIIPTTLPDTDWHELEQYMREVGMMPKEALEILKKVRQEGNI